MIICLSGFVIAGTSPTSAPISARNDIGVVERMGVSVGGCERMLGVGAGGCERMLSVGAGGCERMLSVGAGGCERMLGVGARYSPHHQQLLQQLAAPAQRALPPAARSSSSSAESVSSHSASPPPAGSGPGPGAAGAGAGRAGPARCSRVRTLYACLGESEGELSFEPNQIITNVTASGEPGWLRGTLNGKTGLVPENYVEPLP